MFTAQQAAQIAAGWLPNVPTPLWLTEKTYQIGACVIHNNAIYIALENNQGSEPPSADWDVVLSAGGGGTPGSPVNSFQYNDSGAFGGAPELVLVAAGLNPSSITLSGVGGSHGSFASSVNLLAALNNFDDGEPALFVTDPAAGGEVSLILASSFTDVDTYAGLRIVVDNGDVTLANNPGGGVVNINTNSVDLLDNSGRVLSVGPSSVDVTGPMKINTSLEIVSGGSTTISTGVGSIKMSTANPADNAAWIPMKYAGNTYFIPAWTTNAP